MKRILITGAGGSPAVNFTRSLQATDKEYHLVGTDSSKYYILRAQTNKKYLIPGAYDEEYIPVLNKIIAQEKCEFLHVQNDVEMQVISENREKLHIKTFLPTKETVRICMDKFESYKKWQEAGLIQPKTMKLDTPEDLQQALDTFGKIWIRDVTGAGGRGSLPCDSFKVAKAWMDFKQGWGKYTAAECLTPDSVTWMSLWKDGELIVAQGRKRLYWELGKVSPSGISGATGSAITYSDPKLDEIAQKAIFAIDKKPNGIFSVDLTYDRNGVPNPTEINIGRFFTTHEFFTKAGLNMPQMLVELAFGEYENKLEKKISPLPDNLLWVRGMDFLPVMSSLNEVEKFVKQKEELVKTCKE